MEKIPATFLGIFLLAPLWSSEPALTQEDRAAAQARDQEMVWIAANREGVIESIVATWEGVIEQQGGSPSQLESTLQHVRDNTLLEAREAQSLEQLNALLARR